MARPSLCQASSIFPKKNSPDGLIFSHPRAIIAVRKDYRFGKGGQSNMMCKDRLTSVRRSSSYQFLCKKHKVITPMITKLY